MTFRRLINTCSLSAGHGDVALGKLSAPFATFAVRSFGIQSFRRSREVSSLGLSSTEVFATQKRYALSTLNKIEQTGGRASSRLLKDVYPEIALEVDSSAKNKLIPSNAVGVPPSSGEVDLNTLTFDSGRRIPWKCKECAYQWVGSVMSRTILKSGCPSCHRRNNPLVKSVDPKILQEYETRRNSIFLDPETLEITSKEKLWWCCGSCGCQFIARVCDRMTGKAPCPECDRGHFADFKVRKLLLEEFHPTKNGDLTLAKLRPTDKLPVWWLCHECGHEYSMPLAVRVSNQKKVSTRNTFAGACPKCTSRRHIDHTAEKEEKKQQREAKREADRVAKETRIPKKCGRKPKNANPNPDE